MSWNGQVGRIKNLTIEFYNPRKTWGSAIFKRVAEPMYVPEGILMFPLNLSKGSAEPNDGKKEMKRNEWRNNMKNAENYIVAVLILMLMASNVLPMANAQTESIVPTDNEINITGPHAVFFNVSGLTPLENRQRLILQGNKTSKGCQYPDIMLRKTKAEANITKVIRELAVNPDTCQQLVEQGTLNEPPENPNPLQESKIIFQKSAQLFPQSTNQVNMTTNWYDPLPPPYTKKVNFVYDQINFNYDGTYVYPNWVRFGHWWYTDTHWYDVSYSTEYYNQPSNLFIYARSYDQMENDWFLDTTTNVYYQPNIAFAFPDGSVAGDSTTWDDGLIWYLLHWEKILS